MKSDSKSITVSRKPRHAVLRSSSQRRGPRGVSPLTALVPVSTHRVSRKVSPLRNTLPVFTHHESCRASPRFTERLTLSGRNPRQLSFLACLRFTSFSGVYFLTSQYRGKAVPEYQSTETINVQTQAQRTTKPGTAGPSRYELSERLPVKAHHNSETARMRLYTHLNVASALISV